MTITDADKQLAWDIWNAPIEQRAELAAAHRLASVIEGRRQMRGEVERALRIHPEWCANWGMDSNMRAAAAAANECADMIKALPADLPDDDEDAGCAIAAAIRAIPLEK